MNPIKRFWIRFGFGNLLSAKNELTNESFDNIPIPDEVLPGIDTIWEAVDEKLSAQLSTINDLDSKASIFLSVLVAATGAFLVGGLSLQLEERLIIGITLLVAIFPLGLSYLLRGFQDIAPGQMTRFTRCTEGQIKQIFLNSYIDAYQQTKDLVDLKADLVQQLRLDSFCPLRRLTEI